MTALGRGASPRRCAMATLLAVTACTAVEYTTVVNGDVKTCIDDRPPSDVECCEAIKVSAGFFYTAHLGARTYGLFGNHYEWDINPDGSTFYFNETLDKWVYGDRLPSGAALITHVAVKSASCPNATDWVRVVDLRMQATNDIFRMPVKCVDPSRRIVGYDRVRQTFYGDEKEHWDAREAEYDDPSPRDEEMYEDARASMDELDEEAMLVP